MTPWRSLRHSSPYHRGTLKATMRALAQAPEPHAESPCKRRKHVMMNVDSSALGIRIDHRHAREKRANEKNRACSERTHLLEHCSARKIAQGNWELGPNGIGETVLRSFGSGIKCPFFIGPNGVPNVMRLRTISEAQGWQLVRGRARPIFPWASPGHSSQFTG